MLFSWNIFWLFALVSLLLWAAGAVVAFLRGRQYRRLALGLTLAGIAVYVAFIIGLWTSLGRPPLRTLGETRLWYSLFMMASGWLVYRLWRYRWILSFSLIVAAVFIIINLAHPDIHDQSLMPALQSAWFVPHVTAYIFSYSLFGCCFLMAVIGLWRHTDAYLPSADRLIGIGLFFLTFGMLSGCIWAKQAWGDYWTWDPKETWAAATWCACLLYVHLRLKAGRSESEGPKSVAAYTALIVIFLLLQMCWYGVNFLPSATQSMHSYTQ